MRNQFLVRLFDFLEGVAVASGADSTTPHSAYKTIDLVIEETEHFSLKFFLNGLTVST